MMHAPSRGKPSDVQLAAPLRDADLTHLEELAPRTLRRHTLPLEITLVHHDHVAPVRVFKVGRVFLRSALAPKDTLT